MKKNTLYLLLSLVLFISSTFILTGLTFGWFAKAITVPVDEITSGDLTYIFSGELISNDVIIVPGLELVLEEYNLVNTSSIPSQMRMKIAYLAYVRVGVDVIEQELYYQGNSSDFISMELGPNFERTGDYWYYTENPLIEGPEYIIGENSGLISLFTSLIFDGTLTGIDFASRQIYIVITVEVKQASNVSWSELVNINFQTGSPY